MLYKEITDSVDEKTSQQRHNDQTQHTRHIGMSGEGRRGQRGGRGEGRAGQVQAGASSGQAGNVSLWRGANWLGAALVGFSFKHHD